MFNTAKKEFILKYPGLINALNNTFNNVEVKKDFFSLNDEVYLKKDFVHGNNHLELFFHLNENNIKLKKIEQEIDFDYYISNKHEKGRKFDLNKKLDYGDFVSYFSPTSNFYDRLCNEITDIFIDGTVNYSIHGCKMVTTFLLCLRYFHFASKCGICLLVCALTED